MQPFNLSQCPLTGVSLIEASAGTGKTHALAGLYLRLIIENKLAPQQILVITFTKAATAELKGRIRKMLHRAKQAFQTGNSTDELFQSLLEKYTADEQRKTILRQLVQVLANYDETAIYTIHGFCDRILRENAFESGIMFDAEIIANQQHIEEEFAADYWRRNFYCETQISKTKCVEICKSNNPAVSGGYNTSPLGAELGSRDFPGVHPRDENHPLIIKYALDRGLNKEKLLKMMREAAAKPDLLVIPDLEPLNINDLETDYKRLVKTFNDFREIWKNQKDEIIILLQNDALKKTCYGKHVRDIELVADDLTSLAEPPLPLPADIEKLTGEKINSETKKGLAPPQHPIFLLGDNLIKQAAAIEKKLNNQLLFLQKEFLDELKNKLPQIKQQKNVLYYDDLLFQARKALKGDAGIKLAETLRSKYQAVLVDEFQDTDPVQFAILESIFIKGNEKTRTPIFYIGDPKQAIYSFRGADVFAYLKAVRRTQHQYTMMNNWRSEEPLVNAVNTLFGFSNNPFVYKEIEHIKVTKPAAADTKKLLIAGESEASLQLLFLPAEEAEGKYTPVNLTIARKKISHAVVAEIAKLLKLSREGKAFIGDKPLKESDIAILVRKNAEAANFQTLLTNTGIPSTLQSTQSIFKTAEAHEMKRFMLGVVQYENDGLLLAALATSLVGLNALAITQCMADGNILELWRRKFKYYHDHYCQSGFLTMFYLFLEREHIRSQIMAYQDGVRRMTNYLHLAEEIHLAQIKEKLGMIEVLRWFDLMQNREGIVGDGEQLRLESDKNAVRLVTIHKSKGLEYPIVFCPFVWESADDKKSELFCFHDEQNDRRLTCDLDFTEIDNYRVLRKKEFLAEESRLLYVALTRAKNRCYFVWGNIKNIKKSALYYLLYSAVDNYSDDVNLTNESMLERIKCLSMLAPRDIKISSIDETVASYSSLPNTVAVNLIGRQFKGSIDQSWKIASFTYLTSAKKVQPEEMLPIAEEEYFGSQIFNDEEMNQEDMFSFPRGARAGSLLHEILEGVSFDKIVADEIKSVILGKLRKYNYDNKWEPAISRMMMEIAQLNLTPGGASFAENMEKFSLAHIPQKKYLKEVEFYFPLKELSVHKIIKVLEMSKITNRDYQNNDLYGSLKFSDLNGFLKGFIDMVFEYQNRFYLLDWKSNYLGANYADYSPGLLKDYMSKSSYVLQYLIYVVALDKYLQTKIKNYSYEKNFGGVYYIFLRGINSQIDESSGVYYDMPSIALIKQLKEVF